jgi:hypothetical protein
MKPSRTYAALRKHYKRFFRSHDQAEFSWDKGPLRSKMPDFRVMRFTPGPQTTLWTYLTIGAWEVDHCPTHRHEFFVIAREPHDSHVETLAMMAYYHLKNRLGLGHTLPNGRPWLPGSTLDHFLLSLPYTFGPKLEELSVGDVEIQVLWALPITESEVRFRHDHGLEALESRFEDCDLEYWDHQRGAVIPQ